MKIKHFLTFVVVGLCSVNANAQDDDKNLFNHLSVGVTLGTPGVGVDVAMPIGDYVQVRTGVTFVPNIKLGTDLSLNGVPQVQGYDIPDEIEVEAEVGFTNGKLLFDVFPFKSSSFHVTAGAYFGSSRIVKAYNKQEGLLQAVTDYNNMFPNDKIGYELGDYLLTPDAEGNINAELKTAGFKPYLGLGFGRAVPKKRIGFMFEAGVMFWGSPKLYCNDVEIKSEDIGGEGGDLMKDLSKISVYPVINFRLCCRIL